MCLAMPVQIEELEGTQARVTLQGNSLAADVSLIDDPAVGDWVLVHAGFAIERLDPEEAAKTIEIFAEMGEVLGDSE